jgi:hypothetical protein
MPAADVCAWREKARGGGALAVQSELFAVTIAVWLPQAATAQLAPFELPRDGQPELLTDNSSLVFFV